MSLRRSVAVLAGSLAFAAVLVSPAGAGVYNPTVEGEAVCGDDGQYTITWTLDNGIDEGVTVDDATLSGALTGSVTFTPNPTAAEVPAFSTGTTVAPGTTSGTVDILVEWTQVGGDFDGTSEGSVELEGDCEAVPTTTTTAAPTTTVAIAPAAVAAPTFTG